MIGSHVAWVFVALLLGVCIGWLTYKRGRARLLDAIIWIVVGLVIAAPILLPNLPAAATPLGTLLALLYFVGCPLGWTWRHGAIVEHRCAETDAKGFVFRGATMPPRWQALSQQRDTRAARTAGLSATPGADAASSPPVAPSTATAHAVWSDGKDVSPSTLASTGANAGMTTSPLTAPVAGQAPAPSTAPHEGDRTGVDTSPSPSAQSAAIGSTSVTPLAADVGEPKTLASPHPIASEIPPTPASSSSGTPFRADAPTPVTATTSAPEKTQTQPLKPAILAQDQAAQTSLDLAPSSQAAAAGKVEPQTTPAALATSEPPASAPVPDQHKHAGVRPPGFVNAREDRPDDLQLIRGIGPQNEGRLHGLGIWHFDQIGAWSADEVRWVGSYLAFPGRIDREKWVEQASAIAAGAIIPKAAARRPARPQR